MKKRFFAWLLTLTLTVGLLPAVTLAEASSESDNTNSNLVVLNPNENGKTGGTVTVNGTTYTLYLGQGTQRNDGTLGYWLDPVNRGFIPGETEPVNEFKYYLFLRGTDNADAPKAVYNLFWAACEMTATVTVDNQGTTAGTVGTASDGYHKYILTSVSGAQSGSVSVVITNNNDSTTCTLTSKFQFTAATKLMLDTDAASYSFSIENAVKNQSYFFYIDLDETQTVTVSGTLSDEPVGRLVLAQTAEGTSETMLWWRWNSDSNANTFTPTITTDKILLRVTNNADHTISGTVAVTATQSGSNTPSGGNQPAQGSTAAYIGDYVIGFAVKESDGEVTRISENSDGIFGHGTAENTSPDVPYQAETVISIAAATKRSDSNNATIYDVDVNVTDGIVIKKLWLETVSGDNTTFSWNGDTLVTELTSVEKQSAQLYVKEGRNCRATVCAQIAITIGEETYEKTVRSNISLTITEFTGQTRPASDTVDQLNAFLKELAGKINTTDQTGTLYDIKLGNTTYEGTIDVPRAFVHPHACLHFTGASGNGRKTVIKGSLDINGTNIERISNIHFVANDSNTDQTRAIFGGGLRDVLNCSFYGYDVALDSSEGLINARKSVFVNNEIAASVKINDSLNFHSVLSGDWSNNTFINNEIAVQILSLTKSVSPYYFRVYDSNFINNGTDIDAQCGGTLYMYRNYFGQYQKDKDGHRPHPGKHHADRHNGREHLRLDELLNARTETKLNGILEYTRAKVNTENETKVITNPRWLHPVKGWWGHNALVNDTFFGSEPTTNTLMTLDAEPEYADILVADWESETVILNKESSALTLDASAFTSAGEKEIGVVDENENPVGTWNFK